MSASLERLAKWRAHFAGWQLGTRSKSDPEAQAVRDHREATLVLRAEVTALTALLVERGVFTAAELTAQVEEEAEHLMRALERRWPGATSSGAGMHYNLGEASEWMKGWKP